MHACFLLLGLVSVVHAAAPDPVAVISLPEAPPLELGVDSQPRAGVTPGTVSSFTWKDSKVFPGTVREYHVYLPAGLDPEKPAALMVFQDGHAYRNPKGDFRATVVMDNLIASGEIPPMIGIFINPGDLGEKNSEGPWKARNRSVEYDTLSDAYARFLIEEILPEVAKLHPLSADPEQRGICGMSSGGICAWTVAWQRPDAFRKVISHIGSFANIRGGDVYPGLIRKEAAKPIRGFFQDGIHDLDNAHGSWPLGNMQMQAALKYAKYDHRYVWTHGSHSGKDGGALFPEAMRWLWRKGS